MVAAATDDLRQLADADSLAEHVRALAGQISADHPGGVTLVGVLKGCTFLLADLARALEVPARLELVAVAPYDGTAGRTRVVKDLDRPVRAEPVVLVTGTVDTGLTADFLLRHLAAGEPASVRLCTLADKRARRIVPVPVDYRALDAPDAFLLGYGLDYRGRYRNLPGLWQTDAALLAADPDRHLAELHRRSFGEAER